MSEEDNETYGSRLVLTSGSCLLDGDILADWTSFEHFESDLSEALSVDLTRKFSSSGKSPIPPDSAQRDGETEGGSKSGSGKEEMAAIGETTEGGSFAYSRTGSTSIKLEKLFPLIEQNWTLNEAKTSNMAETLCPQSGTRDEAEYRPSSRENEGRSAAESVLLQDTLLGFDFLRHSSLHNATMTTCRLGEQGVKPHPEIKELREVEQTILKKHENASSQPQDGCATFEVGTELPSTVCDEVAANRLEKPLVHSRTTTLALRKKRNRESARRSYIRKQSYVRNLEKSIRTLEATNQSLQSKIEEIKRLFQKFSQEKVSSREKAIIKEVCNLLESLDPDPLSEDLHATTPSLPKGHTSLEIHS